MALPMVIYQRYRVRGSTWYGGSNSNGVAEPGSSWVQGLLGCGRVVGRLYPLSASSEGQVVATAATAVSVGVPAR